MGKFSGDYAGRVDKTRRAGDQKSGNVSETRKDRGKVTMDGLCLGHHQGSRGRGATEMQDWN